MSLNPLLDTAAIARVRSAVEHGRARRFIAVPIDLSDLDELLAAINSLALAAELREARDRKFLTDVTSKPASSYLP